MRYAIISDVHANESALRAVLTDAADEQVEKIICLGDVLGYGPEPVAALELVYDVRTCASPATTTTPCAGVFPWRISRNSPRRQLHVTAPRSPTRRKTGSPICQIGRAHV